MCWCFYSAETTESELCRVFSAYGNVKSTKIIVDRAGVSKGYGFVTFDTPAVIDSLMVSLVELNNQCHHLLANISFIGRLNPYRVVISDRKSQHWNEMTLISEVNTEKNRNMRKVYVRNLEKLEIVLTFLTRFLSVASSL